MPARAMCAVCGKKQPVAEMCNRCGTAFNTRVREIVQYVDRVVYVERDRKGLSLEEIIKDAVLTAYRDCGNSASDTARRLNISRSTMYRHLGIYGVKG